MTVTRLRLAVASVITTVGVMILAIATAPAKWVLGAALVAALGVAVLVGALLERSARAVAAAAGLIVAGAALAGFGRAASGAASLTAAALGALTFFAAELAWWSIDLGTSAPAAGVDRGRLPRAVGMAVGGGAFGGLAVGLAYSNTQLGSLAVAVAGCLATCMVVGIALMLAPGAGTRTRS